MSHATMATTNKPIITLTGGRGLSLLLLLLLLYVSGRQFLRRWFCLLFCLIAQLAVLLLLLLLPLS